MTKSAAEHWVCFMLSRFSWAAALTRDGIERTDILAVRTDSSRRMIEVQVKGAQDVGGGERTNWPINSKAQQLALSDREWFVLVLLPKRGELGAPRSFVIPRDHLSAAAWIVHRHWQNDPSIEPGKRNATVDQARVAAKVFTGYEDRWDLLDARAFDAPVLLPPHLREWAQQPHIGLPAGHSWADTMPRWSGELRADSEPQDSSAAT